MNWIIQRKWQVILLGFLIITGITMGGLTKTASALTWELPDRSRMGNPDGSFDNGSVMLEIAQTGNDIFLDANESWAKVYYDPSVPSVPIQIFHGGFDCSSGKDLHCNDPSAIDYEFYYASAASPNASDHDPVPFYTVNSSSLGTGWDPLPGPGGSWPVPPTGPLESGAGMKYVIYIRAVWRDGSLNPGTGRINAFKIATADPGGLTGYWGGPGNQTSGPVGRNYSIQDRDPGHSSNTEEDMTFEFATPCDLSAVQPIYLKWKDADVSPGGTPDDGSQFPGDRPIEFELIEMNLDGSGQTQIQHITNTSAPISIGTNDEYREIQFPANPSKKYEWRWHFVNRDNGIQLWMPFDNFYYDKTCMPPGGNPPAPSVGCVDTGGNVTVNWGAAGLSPSSYNVDLADSSNFANNASYKTVSNSTFSTTVPSGLTGDFSGSGVHSLTTGTPYWIRIFYQGAPGNPHSDVTQFTATLCGSGGGGTVQGRVFYDEPGVGTDGVHDASENVFVKNPSGTGCGAIYAPAVINVQNVGTTTPSFCNPSDPAYAISVPADGNSRLVSLNPMPGWIITTPPQSTTLNSNGQVVDRWFGVRLVAPTITTHCSGVNSLADASWASAGIGVSSYYVDIADASNFAGNASNLQVGSGVTSRANIANGFNPLPGSAGVTNTTTLTENAPYGVRIFFAGPGLNFHTATAPFNAQIGCLPPPLITCTSISPNNTEPGAPAFNLDVFFANGPAPRAALTSTGVTINVSGPGGFNSTSPSAGYSPYPLPAGQTTYVRWNGFTPPPNPGLYTVKLTFSGGNSGSLATNPVTCPIPNQQLVVANRPYFRAYGGDVVSGIKQPAGLNPPWCPGWESLSNTTINSYNDGAGKGAGSQLAALALGSINEFLSTTGQTAPSGPKGVGIFGPPKLTFANASGTYGGNAGFAPCPPDYFNSPSRPAAAGSAFWTGLFTSLLGLNNGDYYLDAINAPLPFIAGAPVAINSTTFTGTCILGICLNAPLGTGRSITLYVKGDVIISSDINFANTTGGWDIGTIPSLYIIAQGNIYVKPGVHTIDAVLIAQPDTTSAATSAATGRFYSCADGPGTVADVSFVTNNCDSNLVVNGTVIAQHFRLYRIHGTRLNSSANELSSNIGNIAEIFNAGPETWLTVPAPFTKKPIEGYDAITGLPPVL